MELQRTGAAGASAWSTAGWAPDACSGGRAPSSSRRGRSGKGQPAAIQAAHPGGTNPGGGAAAGAPQQAGGGPGRPHCSETRRRATCLSAVAKPAALGCSQNPLTPPGRRVDAPPRGSRKPHPGRRHDPQGGNALSDTMPTAGPRSSLGLERTAIGAGQGGGGTRINKGRMCAGLGRGNRGCALSCMMAGAPQQQHAENAHARHVTRARIGGVALGIEATRPDRIWQRSDRPKRGRPSHSASKGPPGTTRGKEGTTDIRPLATGAAARDPQSEGAGTQIHLGGVRPAVILRSRVDGHDGGRRGFRDPLGGRLDALLG